MAAESRAYVLAMRNAADWSLAWVVAVSGPSDEPLVVRRKNTGGVEVRDLPDRNRVDARVDPSGILQTDRDWAAKRFLLGCHQHNELRMRRDLTAARKQPRQLVVVAEMTVPDHPQLSTFTEISMRVFE